ncbi:hypothetical protein AB0F81_50780 [Actinoplanes sp. NPDC024001]|uniref:hypothetical protein n=1 Tax=Actinoplanes sp. NPDC024001 TaxID=3154598 RepID=UPI0033C9EF3D
MLIISRRRAIRRLSTRRRSSATVASRRAQSRIARSATDGRGERKEPGARDLGPWIAAFKFDAFDHLVGACLLPGIEHRRQQRYPP